MDIHIKNLSKSYGNKRALAEADLTFRDGTFTAVLGPSGCGKTTLMRCLAGFLTPDQGVILFGEEDVTHLPPQKRETAMVFQNYALWPHMTVYENIAYGLKLRKTPKEQIEQKVYNILDKVEIDPTDVKKRFPQQYSGGQQQRIALARALVLEPKLLLMDEPLSNLDAKVRQRLRIEIRRLQKSLGITAVYVTHDQEEAFSMADQVVLMDNGYVVQVGSPEDLYDQPKSYFAAHFLGNSNTLDIKMEQGEYFLGRQKLELERHQNYPYSGRLNLVIRSEEAKISFKKAEDSNHISLKGILHESLFTGSTYRNWIEIEGQNLFVDTDQKVLAEGDCYVHLPKNKCFIFPNGVQKGELIS